MANTWTGSSLIILIPISLGSTILGDIGTVLLPMHSLVRASALLTWKRNTYVSRRSVKDRIVLKRVPFSS
jgi:hypothetical protein